MRRSPRIEPHAASLQLPPASRSESESGPPDWLHPASKLHPGNEIQSHEHPVLVGHVANQPPQRQWQLLDEGRGGNQLLGPGKVGLLVNIDNLQVIASL